MDDVLSLDSSLISFMLNVPIHSSEGSCKKKSEQNFSLLKIISHSSYKFSLCIMCPLKSTFDLSLVKSHLKFLPKH